MQYYSDKVILITGATSGLGLSLVTALSLVPRCRIIAAGRSKDKLKQVLKPLSCEIKYLMLDLNESDNSIKNMIESAFSLFGTVDIVINCAGMGFRGTVQDTKMDVHRMVMQVDYFGQVAVIKALVDRWAQEGPSSKRHIIQVSSVQGYFGIGGRAPYSAAKHALVGFIDSLRTEIDGSSSPTSNVIVTMVCPGYIQTNHSSNAITGSGETYSKQDETTALGDSPDHVAHQLLTRAARLEREVIIADSKIKLFIKIRYLAPQLYFRIIWNRYQNARESLLLTIYKWLRNM